MTRHGSEPMGGGIRSTIAIPANAMKLQIATGSIASGFGHATATPASITITPRIATLVPARRCLASRRLRVRCHKRIPVANTGRPHRLKTGAVHAIARWLFATPLTKRPRASATRKAQYAEQKQHRIVAAARMLFHRARSKPSARTRRNSMPRAQGDQQHMGRGRSSGRQLA